MTSDATSDAGPASAAPWAKLSSDYERARAREDSLDRLVEWPAQREALGKVEGKSILDLGCGNGSKVAQLVEEGAAPSVGVDLSADFIPSPPERLDLVQGDLSDLGSIPALTHRTFDRILFLQSFGYASDPIRTLQAARDLLADDGFILLTRTHPIRYAVERSERDGTSLGEEYYAAGAYSYSSGWNSEVTLTHDVFTIADLLNQFSAAGLWVEHAAEPRLSEEDALRFPHKQEWMNKYLGILVFRLRPRF